MKRILNFAPAKLEHTRLKHDSFLDYYLCESHLECHRGFLRLDDYYVKVLTLKEPSAHSFPLIFQRLLEVEANFFVVTEWKGEDSGKSRSVIQSRRRHFHTTKRSFISYMNTSDAPAGAQDVLVDDSKEAQIHELGEALKELEVKGNYFGKFSLTVVIYDLDLAKVETACADFYKVFSIHDAQLCAPVSRQPSFVSSDSLDCELPDLNRALNEDGALEGRKTLAVAIGSPVRSLRLLAVNKRAPRKLSQALRIVLSSDCFKQ